MVFKQLVVCLALVPALIVAESYYLTGCSDFKSYLDENAATQQGIYTLSMFFDGSPSFIYLWDPSPAESNQSCSILTANLNAKTFAYTNNNAAKTYGGTAKYVLSPQVRLELNGTLPNDFLGAYNKGFAAWYPIYISATDVAFIACRPSFFGRRETIYLLTNQNYGGLNTTCAAETVNTALKRGLKYVPSLAGGASNCTI